MELDDMIETLPNLSPAALQAIHARTQALLRLGGKNRPQLTAMSPQNEFARDLYGAITDLLKKRTQIRSMPFNVFTGTAVFREHFLPAAQLVAEINTQWFPKQTKVERLSILMLYARLVLDYLAEQSKPAVMVLISAALNNLAQIVDGAFPGYAEAGLLSKVQALRTKVLA